MTEVICPYCGAPNAPEAETCKACNNPLVEKPSGEFTLAEGDQPEWLKDLRNFNSGEISSELIGSDSEKVDGSDLPEGEVPEWLARVRQKSQEDRDSSLASQADREQSEGESEESPLFSSDELPSWLFSEDEASGQAASSFSEPGGMDWMSVLHDENPPHQGQTLPADIQGEPNWEKFSANTRVPDQGAASDEPVSHGEPELSEKSESRPEGIEYENVSSGLEVTKLSVPPPSSSGSAGQKAFITDYLDWKTDTSNPTEGEGKSEPLAPAPFEISGEGSEAEQSETMDNGPVEEKKPQRPSLRDELLKASEDSVIHESSIEPAIEQAQLPSWLEAMKPIESVAPAHFAAEADQQIESSGPLAGFQGVLPGASLSDAYSKPPVYSYRLKVTDKQRVYASLLENLIADEAKTPVEEVVKPSVSGIYLRLLIAVALVGILLFISMTGIQIGVSPNLFAPESVGFYDTVKQLTSPAATPARILVAVEYEPGYSPELQLASVYPIQQLLESGANLAIISTLPTGPTLGENLIAEAIKDQPAINASQKVITLGYLPGGTTSLASLAMQPSLAAPTTLSGDSAWSTPILQGIKTISDFTGLVLLTDNPELARNWIEQVQPALASKPMLVISSAQAAPMILPYYNSGQIQGLLAGMSGGAVYDQLAQHNNNTNLVTWTAYQAGLLLIAAAILAGALFYGIRALFRVRPSGERS